MAVIQQILMTYKSAVAVLTKLWKKVNSREIPNAISWLNGQAIIVGAQGTIRTSPDGYAWTTIPVPDTIAAQNFTCVTWTGTYYIAGGSLGAVMTSTDAANWTLRTYGTADNISAIANNGTITVAGSTIGTIRTSTDNGVTWTARTSTIASISKIVWNGSLFLAVGFGTGVVLRAATSPDGITWTTRSISGLTTYTSIDVAWTGSQFTALALASGTTTHAISSADGITWSGAVTIGPVGTSTPFAIIWAGDRLVVSSAAGTTTSATGTTWSTISDAIITSFMCWDGSKIISTTNSSQTSTSVSLDHGVTWTTSLIEPTPASGITYSNFTLNSLAYVNSTYIIGTLNQRVFSSTDGVNWNSGKFGSIPASTLFTCVGGSSSFYVAGGGSGMLFTSTDAATWTVRTSGFGANQVNAVAYNGTTTVIVGAGGSRRYSTDGITWTATTGATTAIAINAVIWANGQFVSIGDNYVAVSSDGIAWTAGTLALSGTRSVVWDPTHSVYVAGGLSGAIRTSTNGTTWTTRTPANTNTVSSLATDGSRIIGVSGAANTTTGVYSDDGGITWATFSMPSMQLFTNVVYNGTGFFAISPNNISMISSTNGITWQNVSRALYGTLNSLGILGADNYIATTAANNTIQQGQVMVTTNAGKTWDWHLATTGYVYDVTYNGTQYVAVGGNSTTVAHSYVSTNLINWTANAVTGPSTPFKSVAYNGSSIYVATINNANTSGNLYSSPDGVTWTVRNSARPFSIVRWLNGQFVALSYLTSITTGYIFTSPDGINWTQVYGLVGPIMADVTYDGTNYIAVAGGTTNKIFTSPDGTTWTPRMTSAIPALTNVSSGGGTVMATGATPYYSLDNGVTWATAPSYTGVALGLIGWDTDKFVAFTNQKAALATYTP
jgi:hypothetical protein